MSEVNNEMDKVVSIDINEEMRKCYIDYARRQREGRKAQKRDTPPPTAAKTEGIARRQDDNNQQSQGTGGGFTISPDTPLDEL